jgi:hypothetical protein
MESIITVSALLLTIVGVYTFFKIEKLKNLLIGQGESVINKIEFYVSEEIRNSKSDISDKHYLKHGCLDKKHFLRLKNAISRNNIYGVEESLITATINELKKTKSDNTGYYDNVLPKFIKAKKALYLLIIIAYICILILFAIISLSIISTIPELLKISSGLLPYFIFIGLAFSIILSIVIMTISLFKKVGFEKEKYKSCKCLRIKNPKINKLYNCCQ